MHRIPNLSFSLRINAMKPDFPIVYSLKGSDFSLLYVSSRITIGNYISNLKFVHFYFVLSHTADVQPPYGSVLKLKYHPVICQHIILRR